MTDDFTAFELKIGAFGTLVKVEALSFKKKVAFQILEGVVNMTPVDTGRARGNWQVDLGDTPGTAERPLDRSGTRTIQRGGTQIHASQLGDSIWISNPLPYMPLLEFGYSGQAPHGMLQVTLNNVEEQFR